MLVWEIEVGLEDCRRGGGRVLTLTTGAYSQASEAGLGPKKSEGLREG